MPKLYDLKYELKVVEEEVAFFKMVRRAVKEAQQSALDYHLGINEDVIINRICARCGVEREDYDRTAKDFNLYILDLIKR